MVSAGLAVLDATNRGRTLVETDSRFSEPITRDFVRWPLWSPVRRQSPRRRRLGLSGGGDRRRAGDQGSQAGEVAGDQLREARIGLDQGAAAVGGVQHCQAGTHHARIYSGS